jgi:hypothetical protein
VIIACADNDYDFVIIGETGPMIRSRSIGEAPRRIADRSLESLLVIRRVDSDGGEETDDSIVRPRLLVS